ncbi:MAG: glycosyltransferase [Patescibacteria group bacterium]|nr:glycosyltransferase [Patescibacteria group bacterium]
MREEKKIKKILVYIPFDFSDVSKGSSVRPFYLTKEIENAFGINSFVISGNKERRKKLFREFRIKHAGREEEWVLYMESSNWHLYFFDYYFILWAVLKIKSRGIFIRDIYYFFAKEYPAKSLKKIAIYMWMKLDYLIYIIFFKLFVPSKEFGDAMPLSGNKNKYPLPSAPRLLVNKIKKYKKGSELKVVYVGGISRDTGHDMLIDSVRYLISMGHKISLNIVGNFKTELLSIEPGEDIEAHMGLSEPEIGAIMKESHIAVIPRKKTPYHDIAMPVKLFDYLSFGLPVVATNCAAMANFIDKNKVGLTCEDTRKGLQAALLEMMKEGSIERYSGNVLNFVRDKDGWLNRVELIKKILIK